MRFITNQVDLHGRNWFLWAGKFALRALNGVCQSYIYRLNFDLPFELPIQHDPSRALTTFSPTEQLDVDFGVRSGATYIACVER